MAKKNKTTQTQTNVHEFVATFVEDEQKQADSLKLIELMQAWSGFEPKIWGTNLIGFGSYHYKYASGHEGDSMLIGFSPRKAEFSLYVTAQTTDYTELLNGLGKFKMGKACLYVKKLADIDLTVLEQICKLTIKFHQDNSITV